MMMGEMNGVVGENVVNHLDGIDGVDGNKRETM